MDIREYRTYREAEILPLYESVGWTSYTTRPDMLRKAFEGSLEVLAAYDDDKPVGIIRAVGDGASILYIQDLLVHPEHQGRGIGSALLNTLLDRYPGMYQTMLITDAADPACDFYRRHGFSAISGMGIEGFMKVHRKG